MTNRRFNWDVIGPGRIAHQLADGLRVIENAALYAVASSRPERAKAFAEQHAGEKTVSHAHTLANMDLMDKIRAEIGLKYPFERNLTLSRR